MRVLRLVLVVAAAACLTSASRASGSDESTSADALIDASLNAMGGADVLRTIRSIELKGTLLRNALEQSERPEGPYISELIRLTESRDHVARRWRQTRASEFVWLKSTTTTTVADGVAANTTDGRSVPGGGQDVADADERLDLSPERLLLTARAGHPRRLPSVVLHAVPQSVIEFEWHQRRVRVFLSGDTRLPSAVEWTSGFPHDLFWSVWGDVTTRVSYSLWWLTAEGVRYPLQWDVVRNGLPDSKLTITDLAINTPLDESLMTVPASLRDEFTTHPPPTADQRVLPTQNAIEPAEGIVIFPNAWNTTLVNQDAGIVVLEAPYSSGYSSQVIAEAARRYPGKRIVAVVSTSDSWPHVGGVREYVARGIPVYVLDRTRPLLQRLVDAPRTTFPDTLARTPKKPAFVEVRGRTTIGAGANRIELFPTRGQTTERQMLAYWPAHKLLYGSDAFQKPGNGTDYFYPQTVSEVRDAVAREHLDVETFFMMHMRPTRWAEALAVAGTNIPGR